MTFLDDLIRWYNLDKKDNLYTTDLIISEYWRKSEQEKSEIERNRQPFMKEIQRKLEYMARKQTHPTNLTTKSKE